MKLIDDWRRAHRFASMWIALGMATVATAEQFAPALHAWLPSWWPAVGAGLFAVTRVLKQHGFDQPVVSERGK